jgi:hypothetical protein
MKRRKCVPAQSRRGSSPRRNDRMKRREFMIAAAGAALVPWPRLASANSARTVAVLMQQSETDAEGRAHAHRAQAIPRGTRLAGGG